MHMTSKCLVLCLNSFVAGVPFLYLDKTLLRVELQQICKLANNIELMFIKDLVKMIDKIEEEKYLDISNFYYNQSLR